MDQLSAELMKIIVPALTTVVGILVAWGLAELRKYIKQKTNSEAATQAFDTVADVVQMTVTSINQTIRDDFKDGVMTDAEKKSLKNTAIMTVKNQIPEATRKILNQSVNNLDDYIDKRIEATVHYEKRSAA